MLKFTLLKNLYYALDPEIMEGAQEKWSGDNRYRTLQPDLPDLPEITSMTVNERYLPYVTLYYLYLNGNRQPVDIDDPDVRIFLHAFYRRYFPEYLVENAPQDKETIARTDILTILNPDKMPGYDNDYAMRELVTVKDLRNGKTGDEHIRKATFPGLRFSSKYIDRGDEE